MNTKKFLCKNSINWKFGKVRIKVLLVMFIFLLLPGILDAQCAMCRAVLESQDDNSMSEGINNGIVYLMAIPYLVVGVIFYMVYRKIRS